MYSSPDVKIMLIGNKCDIKNKRSVTYQEGIKLMQDCSLNYFEETSALNGFNAEKVIYC